MAQFQKGEGGRPKGVPNKITADLRQWITDFLKKNVKQMEKDWQKLGPKDRIVLFERLLKYSLPTLQSTNITTDFEKMTDEQLETIHENLLKSLYEEKENNKATQ